MRDRRKKQVKQTKSNPAVDILACVAEGIPFDVACAHAGIEQADLRQVPGFEKHLRQARAEFEQACIRELKDTTTGWQRWQWLLQQNDPARWGRTDVSLDELDEHKMVDVIKTLVEMAKERGYRVRAKDVGL